MGSSSSDTSANPSPTGRDESRELLNGGVGGELGLHRRHRYREAVVRVEQAIVGLFEG